MGVCWHDAQLCHRASDRSTSSVWSPRNVPWLELYLEGETNSDMTPCTGREMGQIKDLTRHLSMVLHKKIKDLNIKCLWEILCFWVNWENWRPIPSITPDCFGNTEAKLGQSCELYWAVLSVIVDFVYMAHKRGTHGSAGANHFLCQQLQNKWAFSQWGSWEDLEEKTRKRRNVAHWVNLICLSDSLSVHLSQQNYG